MSYGLSAYLDEYEAVNDLVEVDPLDFGIYLGNEDDGVYVDAAFFEDGLNFLGRIEAVVDCNSSSFVETIYEHDCCDSPESFASAIERARMTAYDWLYVNQIEIDPDDYSDQVERLENFTGRQVDFE